jgi:hypothetical protein
MSRLSQCRKYLEHVSANSLKACRIAQQGLNKFALKSKLYINAIRQAFDELQQLKSATA